MPALVTKTIRITEAQAQRLALEYEGASSFLFRELLNIYWYSSVPGIEIMKLRGKLNGANGVTDRHT